MRHVDDVRAGRWVIMVLAPKPRRAPLLVTSSACMAPSSWASMEDGHGRGSHQAASPAAADGATEAHAGAARPEDLPRLFVEAWNKRDPDALASLFDSHAEFVNVTGLWWHDRASIGKAHAYGLERIFNASTLTVDELRVKELSDDVAIVHAAMTLSGQTAIGAIRQPGARKTIFSFVVHRAAGGWTCASAHNTDAYRTWKRMSSDEDGAFRAANYRTGQLS